MTVEIIRTQFPSHYFNKYHLPILSEAAATADSKLANKYYKNFIFADIPLFSVIFIETYNKCNNDCPFCPANRNADKRAHIFMDGKLFSKIVEDLSCLNYQGVVSLFNNNEPLLDKRLPDFIRQVREKIPDAHISIWTNGILLDNDKIEELYLSGFKGNVSLVIDNYSADLQLNPNVAKFLKDISESIKREINIKVLLRDKSPVLTSRGGNAPNKLKNRTNRIDHWMIMKRGCSYPFTQFNVNPSGKVHICCNDVYYENIVGDLNDESIIEIWRGAELRRIRAEIIERGRGALVPCNKCDTITMNSAFVLQVLKQWRKRFDPKGLRSELLKLPVIEDL